MLHAHLHFVRCILIKRKLRCPFLLPSVRTVQPWASAFVREQRRSNSSVQRAYRRRQYTCVAPALDLTTCSDVFTVFKVASIFDAVITRAAHYLLWVDFDAFMQGPLDSHFWRWTTRHAVATIGARPPRKSCILAASRVCALTS